MKTDHAVQLIFERAKKVGRRRTPADDDVRNDYMSLIADVVDDSKTYGFAIKDANYSDDADLLHAIETLALRSKQDWKYVLKKVRMAMQEQNSRIEILTALDQVQ